MHNVHNIRANYKLQSDIEVQSRFSYSFLFLPVLCGAFKKETEY